MRVMGFSRGSSMGLEQQQQQQQQKEHTLLLQHGW
jgi:hypothetical protein